MKFSPYKNYIFLSCFFLSVVIGFSRCVPIEDLVAPIIGDFELQQEYNVSDTIHLKAILRDNFGINKVNITIEAVDNLTNPWTFALTKDSVGARLLKLDENSVIPSTISVGEYELTLTVIDGSGKEKTTTKRFFISGDTSTPTFTDVGLPDLELIGNNLYKGCRSTIIRLAGTARDNVGLKEVRAQFGTYPPIVRILAGQDSVDLGTAFGNSLVIPTDIPNGTTISLQLQATDTEGNVSRVATISILVQCDDTVPVVVSLVTNPAINAAGTIEVIQAQELFITDGKITDDEELDSVFVYFVNGNTQTLLAQADISGTSEVQLRDVFGNILVPIPATARVGSKYQLVVIATDVSGNESVAYSSTIAITVNNPPNITVSNIFVDDVEINFSSTLPNPIAAGSTVRIEGKIQEDVALQYYKVTWGVDPQVVVDLNQADLQNKLPFNLNDPIAQNTFQTNERDQTGTRYILTLYVKDTFNAEIQVRYVFVIE